MGSFQDHRRPFLRQCRRFFVGSAPTLENYRQGPWQTIIRSCNTRLNSYESWQAGATGLGLVAGGIPAAYALGRATGGTGASASCCCWREMAPGNRLFLIPLFVYVSSSSKLVGSYMSLIASHFESSPLPLTGCG